MSQGITEQQHLARIAGFEHPLAEPVLFYANWIDVQQGYARAHPWF